MNAAAKPTAAHTRGPWELRRDSEGHWIEWRGASIAVCLSGNGGLSPDEPAANAARIVACVNACEGLADPMGAINSYRADMEHIEAERDALRAELETCDKHIRMLREDSDMLRAEVATLREILGEIDTHAVTVQNCLNATRRISANRASAYREIDAICYKARAALGGGK